MVKSELALIQNIDTIADKKIILFGASGMGKKIKKYLNLVDIEIFGFCDNDSDKWGKDFLGKKIYAFQDLLDWEYKEDLVIVVTSSYLNEIMEQLKESALWKTTTIYTWVAAAYGVCFCTHYKKLSVQSKTLIETGYQLWLADQRKLVHSFCADQRVNILDVENPILILHPGKVGSSTIFHSLKLRGIAAVQRCDLYYNINCTDNLNAKKNYI